MRAPCCRLRKVEDVAENEDAEDAEPEKSSREETGKASGGPRRHTALLGIYLSVFENTLQKDEPESASRLRLLGCGLYQLGILPLIHLGQLLL